jgi:nicotinic acid mononucleotide adenylyltransferase
MQNHGYFTYGRFNPPHRGHEMMIKSQMLNKGFNTHIILSHSENALRNPLSVLEKKIILEKMFANVLAKKDSKLIISQSSKTKLIYSMVEDLLKKYKKLTMVVGTDRVNTFTKTFKKLEKRVKIVPSTTVDRNKSVYAMYSSTRARESNVKTLKNILSDKLTDKNIREVFKAIQKKKVK